MCRPVSQKISLEGGTPLCSTWFAPSLMSTGSDTGLKHMAKGDKVDMSHRVTAVFWLSPFQESLNGMTLVLKEPLIDISPHTKTQPRMGPWRLVHPQLMNARMSHTGELCFPPDGFYHWPLLCTLPLGATPSCTNHQQVWLKDELSCFMASIAVPTLVFGPDSAINL